MSVEHVISNFEGENFIRPRIIRATYTFNGKGTSLYYYVYFQDSDGLIAGLKLDFFNYVRFTNFKKPHTNQKYKPYFDKFLSGCSCGYDEIEQKFESSSSTIKIELERMARHWGVSVDQFINTLSLAYELLLDAEDDGWIDGSEWNGGEFTGSLPPLKRFF